MVEEKGSLFSADNDERIVSEETVRNLKFS